MHLKALTINERFEHNLSYYDEDNVEKWFQRKTLLKPKDIDSMISTQYNNKDQFSVGIGPIKNNKLNHEELYPWVKKFQKYIANYYSTDYDYSEKSIDYSIRFLIQDIKRYLGEVTDKSKFTFSQQFHTDIIEAFTSEIMSILNQTIIHDINRLKKLEVLDGKDKYARFQSYLIKRFETKNNIKEFYNEYPNLIRILVTRIEYFKENLNELLLAVNEEEFILFKESLGIQSEKIFSINMSMGDTHDNGKSVAILEFDDGKKVVYKPKSLKIASKIDGLMQYLNENHNTQFYIIKRLVKDNYTFEEFVAQMNAKSVDDIKEYYKNYGELIGLSYIMNGSDFHYENIIAYGKNPVIIDMETFLHQLAPLQTENKIKNAIRDKLAESVIGSSMLPVKIMKERSNDGLQGVDLSGLSYGRNKFPFNVLVIKDPATDEMRYEWDKSYIEECQNVPMYKDELFPYEKYKEFIYEGFVLFLNEIKNNKLTITKYIETHFSNVKVRQIIRPTQKYTDLLRFSYHPTCMENAIEREKVLHNLWAYPYKNKLLAKYEFEEMLNGDIPQFFINTNKKSIFSNNDKEIKDIFSETPLEIVKRKIRHLNRQEINEQLNTIKSSLQDFKFQDYNSMDIVKNTQSYTKDDIIWLIEKINNTILENAIIDDENEVITFLEINDGFETEVMSISEGLYNGISGIYLFFVIRDYLKQDNYNERYRKYILNLVLNNSKNMKVNAFFGKGSLMFPLLVEYKLMQNKDTLDLLEKLAKEIMDVEISSSFDWLYGSSNMIPLFNELYKITKKTIYKDFVERIAINLRIDDESDYIGFAHGKSSIYYINRYTNIFTYKTLNKIIQEENNFIKNGKWMSQKSSEKYFSGWCKGDLGIEISRIQSFTEFEEDFIEMCKKSMDLKMNNTLCHGNASLIELLLLAQNKGVINSFEFKNQVELVLSNIFHNYNKNNRFYVYSGLYGEALGMFTGISGVGYQLGRLIDNKIPNILTFSFN
ncbi:type 2 lanthipeptide synthetase LanM [Staphylococcus hominis]|uniref:type 2 lanthipeptide synthetase LanM n=1 Tax=Staphylococcus hominis TaxID=1290 RepID=UPI001F566943|nr:type 2 lanthipeptide synthetase LanM [Staphylococcus hominis]MCI2928350.1 type 2 lanthipeptide synthetase LanM [Staphylococcus hominis]MDS3852887.1 type 2 lanthipeptide synthetase LanM [Staphylococcus hominis]